MQPRSVILPLAFYFLCVAALCGQTPLNERVLVVYNSSASESLAVAKYYMEQRKIPEANRCRIAVTSPDAVKQDEYESRVRNPIRKCLETVGKKKILYIVFSYQTPYVVTFGERGYALDQYAADIWDEYLPFRASNDVEANHPYYGIAQSQGNVYPPYVPLAVYRDLPKALNLYSVWRLDAANATLAKGLVYKAIFAETYGLSGKGCFDLNYAPIDAEADAGYGAGDWDIHQSAELTKLTGIPVVEDDHKAEFGTAPAPLRCDGAALYAGWYSLSHYNDAFSWNPGAIGIHLDSASATNPREGTNWAANALLKGITITSGAVGEPYLEGLPHPDQVFRDLFLGANAGDALMRSTQRLKWRIINIGDPLYRPFPQGIPPFNTPGHHEAFLALAPQLMRGGNPASGIAGLGKPAPPGGAIVSLKSDQPAIVSVPKTVTIPENQFAAMFPIIVHAVPHDGTTVILSMSPDAGNKTNTLVLYPAEAALTLSAPKVNGGNTVTGAVKLQQPAPAEGLIVKLASSDPTLATLPVEVRIAGAATGATFQITTKAVTAQSSAVITASWGGNTRTATLTLVP